ncbi:hypothetical protein K437DRAFT_254985 [Tilletiaria anomala UBC 951]|uniref:VanZ-like domain-containing protein n=1 Tax=Tilletiaria anomala (strain ATCC 24038 / CBS 436.72 / UBC 951) TaxID=1037660 RepID=A0A066WAR6_TILAU|nr:uncharacterized protein K437DRAFT_254985 [Tilletiaria anomala UBC 951]KDN50816.1 hypothetical protein K437DRAFT_254985 [Tilletiaria anomala UBC 951]
MPRLESTLGDSANPRSYLRDCRSLLSWNGSGVGRRKELLKSILLRSVRIKLSADEASILPLRLRPAFIVLNVLDLVLLGFLGFHPNARDYVAINDKILHFLCFFIATALFYCIFDVDDSARRYWFWRHASLYLTFVTCFVVGCIGSEIVQSLLPYKIFQWGDVIANLCGSALGLLVSYHAEARYRVRREIERLYQPLDAEDYGDEDEDDFGADLESGRASDPRGQPGDPALAPVSASESISKQQAANTASIETPPVPQPFSIAGEDEESEQAQEAWSEQRDTT